MQEATHNRGGTLTEEQQRQLIPKALAAAERMAVRIKTALLTHATASWWIERRDASWLTLITEGDVGELARGVLQTATARDP